MTRPAAALAGGLAAGFVPLFVVIFLFLGTAGPGTAGGTTAVAATSPTAGPGVPGAVASGPSAAANESLGARLAAARGWTGQQDTCLDELWTRESGWQAGAKNPSSGAYGIAQALGHLAGEDQGASAAQITLNREGDNYPPADTAGNPAPWGTSSPAAQIGWGLGYIASAYGTPCAAWNHETAFGSY